ncbi:MAG: hypothetical protein R3E01_30905 [Pirellulaceae bacterium]
MFDRVRGRSEIRDAIKMLTAAAQGGEATNIGDVAEYLRSTNEAAYTHELRQFLSGPPCHEGIVAAFFIHYLNCPVEARDEATHFLAACIEESSDLAMFTYLHVDGLDVIPNGLKGSIRKSLSSNDLGESLTAASCGIRFGRCVAFDFEEEDAGVLDGIVIASAKLLRKHATSNNRLLQLEAVRSLAQSPIMVKEVVPLLVECLAESESLVGTSEAQSLQLRLIQGLHEVFGKKDEVVDVIMKLASNAKYRSAVRGGMCRKLGRICATRRDVQKFLLARYLAEDAYDAQAEIGLGLAHQALSFPKAAFDVLICRLDESAPTTRWAAAVVLVALAGRLTSEQLNLVGSTIQRESDSSILESLCRCIVKAGSPAIAVALSFVTMGTNIQRTYWCAILGNLCEQHPEEFMRTYLALRNDELDQALPTILSETSGLATRFLEPIERALRSESAVERRNALLSLRRVDGVTAARLSPALIDLFLQGSDEEKTLVQAILVRFGAASHPFLRKCELPQNEDSAAKIRQLQSLVGFQEGLVLETQLLQVANLRWIRIFVAVGTILENEGAVSSRKLSEILKEKKKSGELPSSLKVSDRTISVSLENLSKALSVDGQETELLEGSTKRAQSLTADGRIWLLRCRDFLTSIDDPLMKQ